jgi:EAL domain-containing protein (putative c-di-GMP-specific phosphodiesterase class I)
VSNSDISKELLLYIIEQQTYGVEYQPIVSVDTKDIVAYEALSRFFDPHNSPVPPDLVFKALHNSPLTLHQVELAQKKLQLAHAPKDHCLFVNLDQDSYFEGQLDKEVESCNTYITLFNQFEGELVVELIENSEINDAKMSLQMIKSMGVHQIKTAIDDVCNEHSMLSTMVLERVDYIKFDRLVVKNKNNDNFLKLVRALIAYAKSSHKKVILEGVENQEDLTFSKKLDVDYVQGFLFRSQFINIRS